MAHFIHLGRDFIQILTFFSCLFPDIFLTLHLFHADDAFPGVSDGWDDLYRKAFAKRFDLTL